MDDLNRYIEKQMNDPEFKQMWEENEVEYRIARNIIHERYKLGLSQSELANRIDMTQSVIARIESGNKNITIKTLEKVAKGLNTNISYLTRNDELAAAL